MNSLSTEYIPKPNLSLRERVEQLEDGEKLRIIEVRVGSDSDFPKIREIITGLKNYPILVRIASAHRTPEAMAEIARAFPDVLILCEGETNRGIDQRDEELAQKLEVVCCIAAAGGSAHIAGMTASETEVPVLAYPVPSSTLGQSESDASMRHMPPGIPNGVSADQSMIATMAMQIYNNVEASNAVYVSKEVVLDENARALIRRFGLEVTHVLDDARIGIHIYDVNEGKIQHENIQPMEVSDRISRQTSSLGSSIPIVIPRIGTPLDTDIRTLQNVVRGGIIHANLRVVPGLSMGLAVHGKVNPTNAILFAAKLIAIDNAETREALRMYREELAHTVRGKDSALVGEQLQ